MSGEKGELVKPVGYCEPALLVAERGSFLSEEDFYFSLCILDIPVCDLAIPAAMRGIPLRDLFIPAARADISPAKLRISLRVFDIPLRRLDIPAPMPDISMKQRVSPGSFPVFLCADWIFLRETCVFL